jgi:hypothetical protein
VGRRVPFVPPFGAVFVAWDDHGALDAWLARATNLPAARRRALRSVLAASRRRGYVVERLTPESAHVRDVVVGLTERPLAPELRDALTAVVAQLGRVDHLTGPLAPRERCEVSVVAAPVFDADGRAVLDVAVQPLRELDGRQLAAVAAEVVAAAAAVTAAVGGRHPGPGPVVAPTRSTRRSP